MFASRAITVAQTGHRYTSAAKFTSTRQIQHDLAGRKSCFAFLLEKSLSLERERLAEIEEETHPNRSFVCALISFLFCPILGETNENNFDFRCCRTNELVLHLGIFPLYFASRSVRAHRQGFFAEATTFSKKALRWSLICFIFGLLIGSSLGFLLFVKRTLFV